MTGGAASKSSRGTSTNTHTSSHDRRWWRWWHHSIDSTATNTAVVADGIVASVDSNVVETRGLLQLVLL